MADESGVREYRIRVPILGDHERERMEFRRRWMELERACFPGPMPVLADAGRLTIAISAGSET